MAVAKRKANHPAANLTAGGIDMLLHNDVTDGKPEICLQIKAILRVKSKADASAPPKYLFNLSDGNKNYRCQLSPTLYDDITTHKFKKYYIVQVMRSLSNSIGGEVQVHLHELEVVDDSCNREIGAHKKSKSENDMPVHFQKIFTSTNSITGSGSAIGEFSIEELQTSLAMWSIKVRVVERNLKEIINRKGEPLKVLELLLADSTGDITAVAWGDLAESFASTLDEGKVYKLWSTNCGIRFVSERNMKYKASKNPMEIDLNEYCKFEELNQDDHPAKDLSAMGFSHFDSIQSLQQKQPDDSVNILAIIRNVFDAEEFTSSTTGKNIQKRSIEILDRTNCSIYATIWNESDIRRLSTEDIGKVAAIRNARVSEYQGRTLSVGFGSRLYILRDDTMDEIEDLLRWYNDGGEADYVHCLTDLTAMPSGTAAENLGDKSIEEVVSQRIGEHKPAVFNINAAVHFIDKSVDIWYPACTKSGCNKKLQQRESENGELYYCPKCDEIKESHKLSYQFKMNIIQNNHTMDVTCFGTAGEKILGCSAGELESISKAIPDEYETMIEAVAEKRHTFTISARPIKEDYKSNVGDFVSYNLLAIND